MTIHSLVDANGQPLAITTSAANVDERKLVEVLLASIFRLPESLYADKGYDAMWLRWYLERCLGVVAHIAYRQWPKPDKPEPITQNFRWVVERTFAWYQRKFRRINIKWERKSAPWKGFISLALSYYWITKLVG